MSGFWGTNKQRTKFYGSKTKYPSMSYSVYEAPKLFGSYKDSGDYTHYMRSKYKKAKDTGRHKGLRGRYQRAKWSIFRFFN